MKIRFSEELFYEDVSELEEQFETVEYTEKVNIHTGRIFCNEVSIDTDELLELDFEEWLEPWLEQRYKLEYIRLDKKYYLTQF